MLYCGACVPSCMRAVFSHIYNTQLRLTYNAPHRFTRRVTPQSKWLRRGYAAEASLARDMPGTGPALIPQIRTHMVDRPANRPSKVESYKKSNLQLELRWLKDPVKLADHTVKLLREDDLTKAIELVRLASKDVECTVSWNHLIDYEMSKARVAAAVKLFNEASYCLVHCSVCVEA